MAAISRETALHQVSVYPKGLRRSDAFASAPLLDALIAEGLLQQIVLSRCKWLRITDAGLAALGYVKPLIEPPVAIFTSPGGRVFQVTNGRRSERWRGDTIWSDTFEVTLKGELVCRIFRVSTYSPNEDGSPAWSASMCPLSYRVMGENGTSDPKSEHHGLGFDIDRCNTMAECCARLGKSADRILTYLAAMGDT